MLMFLNLKLILPRDNEISVFQAVGIFLFIIGSEKYIKKPSQAQFYAAGSESGVLLRKGWFHSLL